MDEIGRQPLKEEAQTTLEYIVAWLFAISICCLWGLHFITESEISKLSLDVKEIRATSTNKASAPCWSNSVIIDTIGADSFRVVFRSVK